MSDRAAFQVDPPRPTSALLEDLMAEAPPGAVTLGWILDRLGPRSYGLVMLLLGLATMVPGLGVMAGVLVLWVAGQMIMARPAPTVPRVLSHRTFATRRLIAVLRRLVPVLRFLERFAHPRWPTPFVTTRRSLGAMLLLLGVSVLSPIPLTQYVPAVAIMAIALAYLEDDGVLLAVAIAIAVLSLGLTGATVWIAYSGADAL